MRRKLTLPLRERSRRPVVGGYDHVGVGELAPTDSGQQCDHDHDPPYPAHSRPQPCSCNHSIIAVAGHAIKRRAGKAPRCPASSRVILANQTTDPLVLSARASLATWIIIMWPKLHDFSVCISKLALFLRSSQNHLDARAGSSCACAVRSGGGGGCRHAGQCGGPRVSPDYEKRDSRRTCLS